MDSQPGARVFFNGVLLTQEPDLPVAEALAVDRGRIIAVGSREQAEAAAGVGAQRVDLAGRTLVPGFNDAHAHLFRLGQLLTSVVDLRGVASIGELLEALGRARRRLRDGAWLLARGYNEVKLREGRPPTRDELDAIAEGAPAFVVRACGHIGVANTHALGLSGIDAQLQPPAGGVVERGLGGEPTGLLRDTAMDLVYQKMPRPRPDEIAIALLEAARHQLERGITSSSDAGAPPHILAVYRELDRRDTLPLRINMMATRRGLRAQAAAAPPALSRQGDSRAPEDR